MATPLRAQVTRLARWDRVLRQMRDLLFLSATGWCVLALLFALTLNTLLGFIVTIGAYIGIAALAVFAVLSLVIVAVELKLARAVVRERRQEAVSLLLALLESDHDGVRRISARALLRALHRAPDLTDRQLHDVHAILLDADPRSDADLMVALLAAMGRYGDFTSIPVAERVMEVEPAARAERRVIRAAADCVRTIRRRLHVPAPPLPGGPDFPAAAR